MDDERGPLKTLRGFARVEIAAGSTRQIQITLPPEAFAFYNYGQRAMSVVPGDYEILYGNSSDAKSLRSMAVSIQQ